MRPAPPRQALRQARTARIGEWDFRKDRHEGLRRSELDELEDAGEDCEEFAAELREAASSGDAFESEEGGASQLLGRTARGCSRLYFCRKTLTLFKLRRPPVFLPVSPILSQQVPQTGSVSQHRWTITCWMFKPKPSCSSKDDTLQKGKNKEDRTSHKLRSPSH